MIDDVFIRKAISLLLPSTCVFCRNDLHHQIDSRIALCSVCMADIDWHSRNEDLGGVSVLTAGDFEGPLRSLIHAFKYKGKESVGKFLAQKWVHRTNLDPERFDLVIPVPMTYWKWLKRGFNPAQVLAEEVARIWGKPLKSPLTRRVLSLSQTTFNRKNRFKNAIRSFTLKRPMVSLKGKTVLLVDDVCTTGATLVACTKLLTSLGVERVVAAAVAKDQLK